MWEAESFHSGCFNLPNQNKTAFVKHVDSDLWLIYYYDLASEQEPAHHIFYFFPQSADIPPQ